MEAAELGIFMVSATVFTILLYHPGSPLFQAIPAEFGRRVLMGLAMGLTLVGIVFSPWGKQSGAHMNPAFTLTFFWLGKVALWDAVFYILAQFIGGIAGVATVAAFAGKWLAHPAVNYAPTLPGNDGVAISFLAEALISFLLVVIVLTVSSTQKLARFTGVFAGACVAMFIIFESPLSGMSMNPARTVGSALLPGLWTALWVYFLAPSLGMLTAAAAYKFLNGRLACPKYHHLNNKRCIFCEHQKAQGTNRRPNKTAVVEASMFRD